MNESKWQILKVVAIAKYGDVMSSLWQVGVIGIDELKSLGNPGHTRYATTLGDRYRDCGILLLGDPRGLIENRSVQHSSGLEVIICKAKDEKRLGVNSCIGMLRLQGILQHALPWPSVVCRNGDSRDIGRTEQCVILGNKSWWHSVLVSEKEAVDTAWRSTPVSVWYEIIGELCNGFAHLAHHQSVEDGDIDADTYGLWFDNGEEYFGADCMYHYWPEMNSHDNIEPIAMCEKREDCDTSWGKMDFRAGEAKSNRRNSHLPHLEAVDAVRTMKHMMEYGPPPFAKWESLTDTANALYEQEATGNITLPRKKADWFAQMEEVRRRLQTLYLGGIGAHNTRRVFNCEDDETFEARVNISLIPPYTASLYT